MSSVKKHKKITETKKKLIDDWEAFYYHQKDAKWERESLHQKDAKQEKEKLLHS